MENVFDATKASWFVYSSSSCAPLDAREYEALSDAVEPWSEDVLYDEFNRAVPPRNPWIKQLQNVNRFFF